MDNDKSNAPRERPEAAEAEYVGANCCQLSLVGSSGEWWGETIYRFRSKLVLLNRRDKPLLIRHSQIAQGFEKK